MLKRQWQQGGGTGNAETMSPMSHGGTRGPAMVSERQYVRGGVMAATGRCERVSSSSDSEDTTEVGSGSNREDTMKQR
jgi:hypothetical protein